MGKTSFLKKAITCFIAGLTSSALFLHLGNSGTLKWFPPVIVFTMAGCCFLFSLIYPLVWHRKEKQAYNASEKIYAFLYGAIRYTIAFNLMCFGWKKILGLQFVVPDAIAQLPMDQQQGEWLTWYYFGYSAVFGTMIALFQLVGAYGLLFSKTQFVAAIALFGFLLNLTLVNIFYQMNSGALLQSILLTMGVTFLVLLEYRKIALFFRGKSTVISFLHFTNGPAKNFVRFSIVALSLFTCYLKSLIQ